MKGQIRKRNNNVSRIHVKGMALSADKSADIEVSMQSDASQMVSLFDKIQVENRRTVKVSIAPASQNTAS